MPRTTRALALAAALPLLLTPALADAAVGAPAGSTATALATSDSRDSGAGGPFERLATYPVYQNVPEGVDPDDETLAEISAHTEDGNTVIYTDAAGKRIGFLDITDPSDPRGLGTLDLAQLGDADDQPTSVEVVGDYVLVVVDTSGGDFENPSGRVDVVRISDRTVVRSIDLGGQPDSIKVSPDGGYAAIAMENQRDEEAEPDGGGEEGDLPQAPGGFVVVLDLVGDPATWVEHDVALSPEDLADMYAPTDPEPEYVDINDDNQLVLTLQENNGVVVIDLPTREIVSAFSAGNDVVTGVDTADDGLFDFTDSIDVPREPDAVAWVGDGLVATANEGDLRGGSRGWSVFDAMTGELVWDAGNTFEHLAVEHGLWNEGRADNKGSEPEGMAFDVIGGTPYAFVGSERSNFVAVYDMTDPREPAFSQVLPTTNGPEGLLPIPSRDLMVVSSETDDAEAGVRATVGVYRLGGEPTFPSIVSRVANGEPADAAPIGWGALSGFSAVPGQPRRLWAVSDSAYATGRIYSVSVRQSPAVIDGLITVTDPDGTVPGLDLEAVAALPTGGFWLADEGTTGADNALLRTDAGGVIRQTVRLPDDVAAGLGRMGLEGIAVRGTGAEEAVYVALQRPLTGETGPRIGRYQVATGRWTWWTYPLSESTRGGTVGLSELTVVDDDTLAVIERDNLNGLDAEIKRIYTVDLPTPTGSVTPTTKRLARDLLPAMVDQHGFTQEKLEGLGITGSGQVYAVTDNDGLDDATGETQLYSLGATTSVFAAATRTSTRLSVSRRSVPRKAQVRLDISVPGVDEGRVQVLRNGKPVRSVALRDGRASLRQRMYAAGVTRFVARYTGAVDARASTSPVVTVRVRKR